MPVSAPAPALSAPWCWIDVVYRPLPDSLACLAVVHGGHCCLIIDQGKPDGPEQTARMLCEHGAELLAAAQRQRCCEASSS